jgi:exodeoxyribonuclease VII large subunit
MKQIFTVTELNENVKRLLEASFDALWVEGEVSNLRRPASGHAYFILKDEKSQIRAVIFRSLPVARQFPWARPMQFELEEGMSVICGGRLSVYHPRGEYQLIVEVVEPKGLGALQKAFEQLKARLQAEGLFDPVHKKRIPFLPQRVGVITSPTGAVIRDILHITARRFPSVDILIAPVRVQGSEAPPEIIRAIADMHAVGNIDVIILARGGGSLEDLAAFNDEGVAREIFRSRIPVISAIGHEIDYTIADFVADLRAPTPSAAAELVMPVKKEIVASLETLRSRLINCMLRMGEKVQGKVTSLKGRLRDPRRAIHDFRILVDDRTERLMLSLDHVRAMQRPKLLNLEIRLHHATPISQIRDRQLALESLRKSVIAGWQTIVGRLRMRMETSAAVLDTLSPLSVLRRGYGIIRTLPEGIIVKNAAAVTVDSKVDVKVSSGSFHAKVTEVKQE